MQVQWWQQYVGLPFLERGRTRKGVDCWGLVWLVYLEQFGIVLPSFSEDYTDLKDRNLLSSIALDERSRRDWKEVKGRPKPGDVIVMLVCGGPHVGISVGGYRMLHIAWGVNASIEMATSPRWASRIEGVWRNDHVANRFG